MIYSGHTVPICPGSHHSNQVASSILSNQLLLPILLHDYGTQSTAQHNESTVWFLFLSGKTKQQSFTVKLLQTKQETRVQNTCRPLCQPPLPSNQEQSLSAAQTTTSSSPPCEPRSAPPSAPHAWSWQEAKLVSQVCSPWRAVYTATETNVNKVKPTNPDHILAK